MKTIFTAIGGIVIWMGFLTRLSFGTEPCPPNPCRSSSGQIDEVTCRDAADWIAVGTISVVQRDRKGYPLNKDFTAFIFTPEIWEKGAHLTKKSFHFKVGWCDNPTEVPDDTSGKFKFYGKSASSTTGTDQYLDFRLAR